MELKHILANYYPHGLILADEDENLCTLRTLYPDCIGVEYKYNVGEYEKNFEDVKPILRPLSDLTREIEHNGERFVPIIKLSNDIADFAQVVSTGYANKNYYVNFRVADGYVKKEIPANFNDMHVFDYLKLLEWKFDIFNLIGTFAIDVNTLQTNPYK